MSNEAVGFLIVAVCVGLVCGIIAGLIALKKNRSQAPFFLLGFFFGPLGVLATALVGPGAPPAPSGMRAVTCPRCNARQNIDQRAADYECWQCKTTVSETSS
ncbi:hypothetical protein [Nocardia thailandica]